MVNSVKNLVYPVFVHPCLCPEACNDALEKEMFRPNVSDVIYSPPPVTSSSRSLDLAFSLNAGRIRRVARGLAAPPPPLLPFEPRARSTASSDDVSLRILTRT